MCGVLRPSGNFRGMRVVFQCRNYRCAEDENARSPRTVWTRCSQRLLPGGCWLLGCSATEEIGDVGTGAGFVIGLDRFPTTDVHACFLPSQPARCESMIISSVSHIVSIHCGHIAPSSSAATRRFFVSVGGHCGITVLPWLLRARAGDRRLSSGCPS